MDLHAGLNVVFTYHIFTKHSEYLNSLIIIVRNSPNGYITAMSQLCHDCSASMKKEVKVNNKSTALGKVGQGQKWLMAVGTVLHFRCMYKAALA